MDAAFARARLAWDTGEACMAAGDWPGALAWLSRAHRLAPSDQNLAFALAGLRLRTGDARGAIALFGAMARRFDGGECWIGLASAHFMAGEIEFASRAMQQALSSHAANPAMSQMATLIADASGVPGWCGLREDGLLLVQAAGRPSVTVDGVRVLVRRERDGYRLAIAGNRGRVSVACGGRPLLGSPIALDSIGRLDGVVRRTPAGVEGWAWHPAAPDRDPMLQVVEHTQAGGVFTRNVVARERLPVTGDRPLARPRGFDLAVDPSHDVHVLGPDGRHVFGSPLRARPMPPQGAPNSVLACAGSEPDLPVCVVIPVHRGLRVTLDCLNSVMATVAAPNRIVIVDDATPEPALAAALDTLAERGVITLIRPAAQPVGFPAAANAGLGVAMGYHVVLLNSDTLVAPGWLEELRAAACSAGDIGTATPISNHATIFSVPDPAGGNPAPDLAGTRTLARLARRANGGRLVDVPTAHGFCMFIRRDCLVATGLFDAALFAQGYGEENDFCERARALSFRHVAVPGVFVAHLGSVSFGAAGEALLRRNLVLLRARHPGYDTRVAAFLARDPLAPARRRLDAARWRARPEAASPGGAVLLVTHGGGGGTARVVAERAQAFRAQGMRPILLLARDGLCEVGDASGAYPNLAFNLPAEVAGLRRLLAAERPVLAELHHLLGHDHSIMGLLRAMSVPYEVWVHDYGWFCARLSFVTGEGRFCGEAPASVCEACIAQWGSGLDDPVTPAALRARSAADFAGARRIVVPSVDVSRRVARHVPGILPVVEPWEAAPTGQPAYARRRPGRRRVAAVGAIGLEKGVRVLLDCAQDAAARRLPLEFVVVGYTSEDDALMATGRVFVTGEFAADEAESLIGAQEADLAFLPSVWPETWCFALSDAWRAGLSVAVFDIGTPALRVRESGRGWVLPLGLPAHRINDVLLSL